MVIIFNGIKHTLLKGVTLMAMSPIYYVRLPGSLTFWLCDLGQVTKALCASVSSCLKWNKNETLQVESRIEPGTS